MDKTIEDKRAAVKTAYPNHTWSDKVNLMSDAQIVALYLRLKGQKKI